MILQLGCLCCAVTWAIASLQHVALGILARKYLPPAAVCYCHPVSSAPAVCICFCPLPVRVHLQSAKLS
jgi:hypothetical protein